MSDLHDFYRIAFSEQQTDLVRAIEARDSNQESAGPAIRAIAHMLKGSGSSFGFPAVTYAAAATEHATEAALSMSARALVLTLDDIDAITPVQLPEASGPKWSNPAGGEDANNTPIRVLLAEDDPLTAALIIHRLEREAFEVTHCTNGLDAMDAVATERFGMIMLDVQMPGADGFAVLDRIRSSAELADVPIVLVTAVGSEGDVVRGFALGADDYILKPFSPAELTARVKRLTNGLK